MYSPNPHVLHPSYFSPHCPGAQSKEFARSLQAALAGSTGGAVVVVLPPPCFLDVLRAALAGTAVADPAPAQTAVTSITLQSSLHPVVPTAPAVVPTGVPAVEPAVVTAVVPAVAPAVAPVVVPAVALALVPAVALAVAPAVAPAVV
jgi:hypothetical protein